MDPNSGAPLFSNDFVKDKVVNPEDAWNGHAGQVALIDASLPQIEGKPDLSVVDNLMAVSKEELGKRQLTKGKCVKDEMADREVEDRELWGCGEFSARKASEIRENQASRKRRWTTPSSKNFEVLPFDKQEFDKRVLEAHALFSEETLVEENVEEPHPREASDGGSEEDMTDEEGMVQMVDDRDLEDNEEKMCPVAGCSEKCGSDKGLLKHMKKTHSNPLICGQCEKTCPNASKLRRHYTVHSKQQPFLCLTCDKTFPREANLKAHIRQHTTEWPYQCDICGEQFKNASPLACHRRKHDEETMFGCTQCSHRSPSARDLERHMGTHTGQKPFQCPDCAKCFARKDIMEQHKAAVHEGRKKYSCPECEYKTAYSSDLSRHMMRKH